MPTLVKVGQAAPRPSPSSVLRSDGKIVRMLCGPILKAALFTGVLLAASVADGVAQTRDPVITAPLPIAPPATEPADAPRNAQGQGPLPGAPAADDRERGVLGAPVFVAPDDAPHYAAPQNPNGPGYTRPAYDGPATPGMTGPTIGRRGCLQYAPAYDEAGRFLANVCVR
jgi:hypothetical protein